MPFLALFTNMAFYHLFLLAFLIGAQIYQSFFVNTVANKALNQTSFRILMTALWPMYFRLQTIVSALVILTYPGEKQNALFRGAASVQGLLDEDNRGTVMLPLAIMLGSSAANTLVLLPKTISTMTNMHRVRAEKVRGNTGSQSLGNKIDSEYDGDRKAAEEEAVRSREDKALTTRFLVYHGASYACNLITVAASVCYAMYIAEKCL
ncbi:hypothetical protein IMSHALPRED_007458 [Imshaugia aleurites]|uniref:TMEM205-like domain-containing protein n=1 Tax=Imshaugia aleurites TaxID=172621 RepID=A0A8H3FPH9_9LECA|nr:hypothetical protein IMSHALPRED_007458 [Imshaugia aleurites]